MIDLDALADELSDLIATESRGLLRHIAVSNPYVDKKTYRLQQAIVRIAEHSESHVQRITDVMEQLQIDPRARTYPLDVSFHHYDSVAYMLDKILAEKRAQIAAYERAIEHLGSAPQARAQLAELLDENRSHLEELSHALPV